MKWVKARLQDKDLSYALRPQIGKRSEAYTVQCLLGLCCNIIALLEPIDTLRQMEQAGDFTARLALLEDMKLMPFGAVWHYHCLQQGVPPDLNWMQEVCRYEEDILAKRI